jgi:hypothetical protein
MSDTKRGPGWWIASDGRWYPPDDHPRKTTGSDSTGQHVEPGRRPATSELIAGGAQIPAGGSVFYTNASKMRRALLRTGLALMIAVGLSLIVLAATKGGGPKTADLGSEPSHARSTTSGPTQGITTTTSKAPDEAQMKQWLVEFQNPYSDLTMAAASLVSTAQSLGGPIPPVGVIVTLEGSCPAVDDEIQDAQTVPAAPMAQIEQDWEALVASFAPIVSDCMAGMQGNDPEFFQQWPSLEQAEAAANSKVGRDLMESGYCEPSATCVSPYTISGQPTG